jgi:pSer/pThr/pTyr-binding forkhead associated (FHA) protein
MADGVERAAGEGPESTGGGQAPAGTLRVDVRLGTSRREMRFSSPVVTIGRADAGQPQRPDIDLSSDESVSRQHAEIRWTGDRVSIVDRGSTNGTWLNGERLSPGQPRWLKEGDRVAVGRLSVLTIHLARAGG